MTGGEQMDEHLLEVKNLKVSFKVGKKKLTKRHGHFDYASGISFCLRN